MRSWCWCWQEAVEQYAIDKIHRKERKEQLAREKARERAEVSRSSPACGSAVQCSAVQHAPPHPPRSAFNRTMLNLGVLHIPPACQ